MHNFDPDNLSALREVEREGSFEGAARSLGLTAPAISHRIKCLEESAGGILLVRGTPVVPTEMGRLLCRHAEVGNALDHLVKKNLATSLVDNRNTKLNIKIVIDDHSLASWFFNVLKSVLEKYPDWVFDIHTCPLDKIHQEINAGKSLIGITDSKKSPNGFSSIPLGSQIYRAVASPKFVDTYFSEGVTTATLSKAPTLRYNNRDDLRLEWAEKVTGEVPNPPTHLLPTSHCFIPACLADIGWCMCPSSMVDHLIDNGRLVELIPNTGLSKKLYWQYSCAIKKICEPLTNSIVEISKQHLEQEPSPTFRIEKRLPNSFPPNLQ